jgi:hypothetical protein
MASTSSLPLLHVWTKCDVFLSFRGTNTRKSLTSHLYHALCQNQIDACIAYKLDGGDRLSLSSWKWLKSHIFRSSFSPKIMQILYFLCLRELTKIVECMENTNDRWFYLFSTKLFQAMCSRSDWELWRCTLQAWKTMRMLWWNFLGSSGLFYLLPGLSLFLIYYALHAGMRPS